MQNKSEREYRPISQPQKGVAGQTGGWRGTKPMLDADKCIHCQLCWAYCPEACVNRETAEIHYIYCKGCGICAAECPRGAIEMQPEDS